MEPRSVLDLYKHLLNMTPKKDQGTAIVILSLDAGCTPTPQLWTSDFATVRTLFWDGTLSSFLRVWHCMSPFLSLIVRSKWGSKSLPIPIKAHLYWPLPTSYFCLYYIAIIACTRTSFAARIIFIPAPNILLQDFSFDSDLTLIFSKPHLLFNGTDTFHLYFRV